MATVCFFQTPREFNRAVIVETDEVFSSPAVRHEDHGTRYRPPGSFDVAEELERLPAPFRCPNMILCQLDPDGWPRNLAAAPGKKVLFVGDTHHGDRPLERRLRAALAEPWDLVVLEFRGSHRHWFESAGLKVAYVPCFSINPFDLEPRRDRQRGITFVGQCDAKMHPRRHHVITQLQKRGFPILVTQANQQGAAKIYNESAITLNLSLNGDFNLRNWEIDAAGGTRVGDMYFRDGHERPDVQTIDGFAHELDSLLSKPHEAWAHSLIRHSTFWQHFSPKMQVETMLLALHGSKPTMNLSPNLWERVAAYEALQERHRLHVADEPLRVEIADPEQRTDAADLYRLEIMS